MGDSYWASGSNDHRRIFRGYYKDELADAERIINFYLDKDNKTVKDAIQSVQDLIHDNPHQKKSATSRVKRVKCPWLMRLMQNNIDGDTGFTEMLAICMLYHNQPGLIRSDRHYTFTLGNRFLRLVPYDGVIDSGVQARYGRLIQKRYGSLLEQLRQSLADQQQRLEDFYTAQKEPLILPSAEEK